MHQRDDLGPVVQTPPSCRLFSRAGQILRQSGAKRDDLNLLRLHLVSSVGLKKGGVVAGRSAAKDEDIRLRTDIALMIPASGCNKTHISRCNPCTALCHLFGCLGAATKSLSAESSLHRDEKTSPAAAVFPSRWLAVRLAVCLYIYLTPALSPCLPSTALSLPCALHRRASRCAAALRSGGVRGRPAFTATRSTYKYSAAATYSSAAPAGGSLVEDDEPAGGFDDDGGGCAMGHLCVHVCVCTAIRPSIVKTVPLPGGQGRCSFCSTSTAVFAALPLHVATARRHCPSRPHPAPGPASGTAVRPTATAGGRRAGRGRAAAGGATGRRAAGDQTDTLPLAWRVALPVCRREAVPRAVVVCR